MVERPSVHPSVCPVDRQQQLRATGLLLGAPQVGDYRSIAIIASAGVGAQQQMQAVSC